MRLTNTSKRPGRIRAALLEWLGIPIRLTDEGFWREAFGNRYAGQDVTSDSMLTLSTVWACARLLSEVVGTLPASMFERIKAGKRYAAEHRLHSIIHDLPNQDTTAAMFWEAVVAAMLLRGVARSERLEIDGRLVGLHFLHPDRLFPTIDSRGLREWRYTEESGKQRTIAPAKLWTIPGFSIDGRHGLSVVAYGAATFGAALAAQAAASSTFEKGLMPTTYFKYPKVLTKPQRDDAREAIKTLSGAVNAGNPAILEADMDVGTIGIHPNDAQLLESRAFSVEEICRWFRVPPFMVGHSEKSTSWGTGIEQQMIGFLAFTLAPWLRRIEQAISKDLLTPTERMRFYPKFAVEGLLRADSAARAAFYSVMVNNGILTRDEVRELEDREPMGGNAAVLTVQTALAPLDSLGQVPDDADQAQAAMRNWLREPVLPIQH